MTNNAYDTADNLKTILKNKGIERIKVNDMYLNYKLYCESEKITYVKGKVDFNKSLSNINIKHYVSSNSNYYKCDYTKLKEISDRNHWVHELDEYVKPTTATNTLVEIKYKEEYEKEIAELKAEILKLKSENKKPETKKPEPKKPEPKKKLSKNVQLDDDDTCDSFEYPSKLKQQQYDSDSDSDSDESDFETDSDESDDEEFELDMENFDEMMDKII